MARRMVTICDKCGANTDSPLKFKITVTGRPNTGGDLCASCASVLAADWKGSGKATPLRRATFSEVVDLDA